MGELFLCEVLLLIFLYSGTPGSYKSYHAVKESIWWLRHGYNVIANFPINYHNVIHRKIKGSFDFVPTNDITVDYLIEYAATHHKPSRKPQTLLVIDEASIKFNSREFMRKDRLDWINFFANHRHFNYDVILITQSDIMLDKQIRQLIEHEYRHRAIANFKWFGRLLGFIFKGLHIYIDIWYPMTMVDKTQWSFFNKRIADCYDTMGMFVGSKAMDKLLERQNIENSKKGVETISNVKNFRKKEQVNKDLSKFVTCLNNYVLRSGSSPA